MYEELACLRSSDATTFSTEHEQVLRSLPKVSPGRELIYEGSLQ